jgi:uncharacterized protein (DUF1697 family)
LAGCHAVRTYIQSGNVVFEARPDQTAALFKRITATIAGLFDRCPAVMFRTVDQLQRILSEDPFKRARRDSTAKFYVTFLAAAPEKPPAFPVALPKEALEAIGMNALDVFMISRPKPNGFYGFPNDLVEKTMGVEATTRNWSTVSKIVEFAARADLRPCPGAGSVQRRRSGTQGRSATEVSSRRGATPPAPRQTTRRGSKQPRTPKA